jgi:hypothetical protein
MITNRLARISTFFSAAAMLGLLATLSADSGEPAKSKFSVKIRDEKAIVVNMEDSGAVDPTQRIAFQSQGNLYININTIQGQTLHLSHFPTFMVNGRRFDPNQGNMRFEKQNVPLPKGAGGKDRKGSMTVWSTDNVRITQSLELYPSKAKGPGQKRLSNNVLITYLIENNGARDAAVGVRAYMDTYVIDNDGCMFASPVTHPKKILDGVTLEGKLLPPYLQMLQRPDLQNPGFISYLTLDLGGKIEKANKLVLTRHGTGFNSWEMAAFASMGDSGIGIFWPIKDLKPGAKREVGYVYGEGIAVPLENEGRFQLSLGGSFEPGKAFTISAIVADPAHGQTLTLELPAGMERVEGKEVQPVAPLSDDQQYSTVLWKARVKEPGEHAIRIRSSTGVTQTKIVTITKE